MEKIKVTEDYHIDEGNGLCLVHTHCNNGDNCACPHFNAPCTGCGERAPDAVAEKYKFIRHSVYGI